MTWLWSLTFQQFPNVVVVVLLKLKSLTMFCAKTRSREKCDYFASVFGITLPHTRSWQGVLIVWWFRASPSSQVGLCRGIIPILITWALWRSRCVALMEDVVPNSGAVISSQLQHFIRLASRDANLLKEHNCPIVPIPIKTPRRVAWSRPRSGWFKLNVDGCSW